MPMKCMDQMPTPMASEPAASHRRSAGRSLVAIRAASRRAVYETAMATPMERPTSQEL